MPPGGFVPPTPKDGRGAFFLRKGPRSHATGTGTTIPPKSAAGIGVKNIFTQLSEIRVPERLLIEQTIKNKTKTNENIMQFMMLMIPAVYQGGKTVDPGFCARSKKNGGKWASSTTNWERPLKSFLAERTASAGHGGARRVRRRQTDRDRWPLHRIQGSARRLLDGRGQFRRKNS